MIKFDITLSKKYFRVSLFHNLRYLKNMIIKMLFILMFFPLFCYSLIEDGLSFTTVVSLLFWLVPLFLFIDDLPSVYASRAKKRNLKYSVEISHEGVQRVFFDGSEEKVGNTPFDKCIRIVERKDIFILIFGSDGKFFGSDGDYLMKSDIVEGSVEEARMIFIAEAGEKFYGMKK